MGSNLFQDDAILTVTFLHLLAFNALDVSEITVEYGEKAGFWLWAVQYKVKACGHERSASTDYTGTGLQLWNKCYPQLSYNADV